MYQVTQTVDVWNGLNFEKPCNILGLTDVENVIYIHVYVKDMYILYNIDIYIFATFFKNTWRKELDIQRHSFDIVSEIWFKHISLRRQRSVERRET